MVEQEVYDGVMSAIHAIRKLDAGQSIRPGSTEHQALTWAIVKLFDDNLLDRSPLTGKELERAQKVIATIRAREGS